MSRWDYDPNYICVFCNKKHFDEDHDCYGIYNPGSHERFKKAMIEMDKIWDKKIQEILDKHRKKEIE